MSASFDPYHRWLGIPPEKQPPNHYALLAIEPFEDNPDVIESAADQRMAHLRNFQTGEHGTLSQKLLNEVAAAKICLLNPGKKAACDASLRRQLEAARPVIARAVPLTPATATAEQTPQESPAGPVPQIAPGAVSVHVHRRRRRNQSWQAPVVLVLVVMAAVVAVVGAMALLPSDDGEPIVREQPEQPERPERPKPPLPPGPRPPAGNENGPETPDPPTPEVPDGGNGEPNADDPPPTDGSPSSSGTQEDDGKEPDDVPIDPPRERLAVPDQDELKAAELRVRKDHGQDLAEAQTAEKKLALAKRLLRQGDKTLDSPVDRFVLFRMAADLAADGGDPDSALDAVDRIAGLYQVDAPAMKRSVLQKAVESRSTSSQAVRRIVDAVRTAAQDAIADGDFETVADLGKTGEAAARRTKKKKLIGRASTWSRNVGQLEKRFAKFQEYLKVLKEDPDNAEANQGVGEWYCFVLGRWEEGLLHLAKGSDGELKTLAEEELRQPTDPSDQKELGDAWRNLGERAEELQKEHILSRAEHSYRKAESRMPEGPEKDALKKWLASRLPVPPDAFEIAEHSYKIFLQSGITWNQARTACEGMGGCLACVETNAEGRALVKKEPPGKILWLGGFRQQGQWVWLTGEKFTGVIDTPRIGYDFTSTTLDGRVMARPEDGIHRESFRGESYGNIVHGYICEWDR